MKVSALPALFLLCFWIVSAAITTTTSSSSAQNPQASENPCDSAQTTFEMGQCAGNEWQKADAEMNSVYKQLMASLSDKEHQAALKTAQQAWLKYRDANCEFDTFENRGGTIHPVEKAYCRAAMTRERTKEIREQMTQEEGH